MISTSDFKTGLTIEYQDSIYTIVEFQHVKPGKGQAFVRTKLRNLRTGALTDFSFAAGEKMEQAAIEKKKMQYLFNSSDSYTFMDMETFEQLELPAERLEYEKNFMLEGMEVIVIDYKGEVLGVQLPEKVALEVIQADPGVRGNTAANATKDAIVETGLRVQVPLFVNQGDRIIVSTFDGKYSSRA